MGVGLEQLFLRGTVSLVGVFKGESMYEVTVVRQSMCHAVDTCPLTKSEGERNLLHEADDDAVVWLESTATAAIAK